jgi:hypothetical protein
MKTRTVTRALVLAALMLNLGVAGVYAQHKPVRMTFSGTCVATSISLQPDTVTDDENLAGDGTLGPFIFRELHADVAAPQPSSTCTGPTQLYFPTTTGAGVFRFRDGSLLTVGITKGATCVDLTAGVGHVTATYEITGGTGRLKDASGTLALTAKLIPVLFNASNAAELLTDTGKFEGSIFGVAIAEEGRDERQ